MLFELAGTAGLDEKKGNMATGKHINSTEDRAGERRRNPLTTLTLLVTSFTFSLPYCATSTEREGLLCGR